MQSASTPTHLTGGGSQPSARLGVPTSAATMRRWTLHRHRGVAAMLHLFGISFLRVSGLTRRRTSSRAGPR
eukprot:1968750-Pleurochrysis_carterae.AAC.1